MGLLDDAIREHLEFKRQHGADAEEVARLENEALGPVGRGEDTTLPGPAAGSPEIVSEQTGERGQSGASSSGDAEQSVGHTGEETAELDMRTVLDKEAPVRAAALTAEESLEWEVPADSKPGAAADGEAEEGAGEPVEDVLEETPDFLRETPDQDRLWFEQQPPRDFDFDK